MEELDEVKTKNVIWAMVSLMIIVTVCISVTALSATYCGVLCDQKADYHTNSTHQYASNKDIVEFLVDSRKLNTDVKRMGSANVYMPLNGSIAKIERIDFIE